MGDVISDEGSMKSTQQIVFDVRDWKQMAGRTSLHKQVNAYFTEQFVLRYQVPADECLVEANWIIALVSKPNKSLKRGSGITWRKK